MRLSAYIPIPRNPPIPDAPSVEDIRRRAVTVARYIQKEFIHRSSLRVRFKVIKGAPRHFAANAGRFGGYHGLCLVFNADLPIPLNREAYAAMLHGGGEVNDASLKLMWEFVGMIEELLPVGILASNISSPGVLRCSSGEIKVDDDVLVSTPECSNYLTEYLTDSRQLGWPKEIPVSFNQAIQ